MCISYDVHIRGIIKPKTRKIIMKTYIYALIASCVACGSVASEPQALQSATSAGGDISDAGQPSALVDASAVNVDAANGIAALDSGINTIDSGATNANDSGSTDAAKSVCANVPASPTGRRR